MEGEASGPEAEPGADAGRVEQSVAKWPKEARRVGCDAWIRGGTRRGKHDGLSGAVVVNGTQHGLRSKASGGRSLPWPLSTPHLPTVPANTRTHPFCTPASFWVKKSVHLHRASVTSTAGEATAGSAEEREAPSAAGTPPRGGGAGARRPPAPRVSLLSRSFPLR